MQFGKIFPMILFMRKLTQDHVANYFRERECELLSEYINKRTKVKYRCKCGNIAEIKFGDFKKGLRCGCRIQKFANTRKHSIEFISNYFKEQGCELLETEYINTHYPMRYICVCRRESKISFAAFQSGKRCKECGFIKLRKPNLKNRRPNAKLNALMRKKSKRLLRNTLQAVGKIKDTKTSKLLGYGVIELRNHITNHPNWSALKDSKWHLDHIFPIKAFVDYGINNLRIINALDNLQPLSGPDNLTKADKYDSKKFDMWLFGKIFNCFGYIGIYDLLQQSWY